MGIQNLLPFVAKACRQANVSEFAGCSVAIDVSCLLHRGLFACMEDRAVGKDNRAYLYYVKKFVDALVALNCHVIMVFDGRPLPAKKDTNAERSAKRKENMRQGEILLSQGRKEEAGSMFRQSTSITREVVETTIQFFRKYDFVDVIVAPYESDAQLAFLTKEKLADVVVTEDSDLIAFGCEKIIFKWDVSGPCTIYEKENLPKCFSGAMASDFDFTKFRRICILSGCDYTQGLKGVGLSKGLQFFLKTSKTELREILPRVPSYLRMPKLKVTDEFVEDFIRAERTFLHQVVYDPRGRCQRPLTPYPLEEGGERGRSQPSAAFDDDDDFMPRKGESQSSNTSDCDYSYAGTVVSTSQSTRLALGNSSQGSSIEDTFHLPKEIPGWSVWSDHYETRSQRLTKVRADAKVEKEKKLRMGAFRMDSPERRRKKTIAVDEPDEADASILVLDDDEDDDFAKKATKKPIPRKSITAPTKSRSKKNEAECSMSTDELMAMYSIDKPTSTVISSSSSAEVKMTSSSSGETVMTREIVEVMEITVDPELPVPKPAKAATIANPAPTGRKRSRLDAIGAAEQEERPPSIPDELPSPIAKESTPPMEDVEFSPALSGQTPTTPGMELTSSDPANRTSTPLTGRSRSLVGGKSAYFGMNRPASLSNPFKKPRLMPPGESPAASPGTPATAGAESPG
ncbi:hypothetical protein PFISCL1PPCAC_9589, partial [Pristionchus fissidentatus]